jgi:hypothetical protein
MRFMMVMIPKVYQPDTPLEERAGEGFVPPEEDVAKMSKYNDELSKAGVLVSLDGLHPLSKGARVAFSNGNVRVIDGPNIEAKEVIGGYWLIDVKSKDEALDWAKKVPAENGDVIEIRQIFEM